MVADTDENNDSKGHLTTHTSHVVEQRVSNLAQGLLTLGTMTGPLLVVLHLIPQGVLAGLFFVMGVQALEGNGITLKILFLLKDSSLTPSSDPLKRINRRPAIWVFVGIQLIGFGATFAITQTIAAVGFPIIILLLIPFRTLVLPKWFTSEELALLDGPTASPFTMVSVGGNFGEGASEEVVGGGEGARQGGSEGILVESDEAKAERGEGMSIERGMKRRGSYSKGEGGGASQGPEGMGMSRRSVSRQPR